MTECGVYFIDDLARLLGSSRRTIERRLRAGTFPLQPLPSFDKRHRWSKADVDRYLTDGRTTVRLRRAG